MLLSPLPEGLQRMVDARSADLMAAFYDHNFAKVIGGHREMYAALLTSQPPAQRYHKGLPLQNIGAGLLFQGRSIDAFKYFVSAYVEDFLSRPPKEGGPPRDTPAARTLMLVYGVPEDKLRAFDEKVLAAAQDPDLARDPFWLMRVTGEPEPTAAPEVVLAGMKPPKEPGQFRDPWDKRVFVGGSYQANFAIIREIERYVNDQGRLGVVAADYRIVKDVHHHALMLLHECRLAIFDVSHEVGQLIEIQAALQYGVTILVVRQTGDSRNLRLTSMLKDLLDQHRVDVRPFQTIAELEALVADFLARNP